MLSKMLMTQKQFYKCIDDWTSNNWDNNTIDKGVIITLQLVTEIITNENPTNNSPIASSCNLSHNNWNNGGIGLNKYLSYSPLVTILDDNNQI